MSDTVHGSAPRHKRLVQIRVIITSASGATKLLVELSPGTFDGSFDGSSDLAVAFIGANALTVADILF